MTLLRRIAREYPFALAAVGVCGMLVAWLAGSTFLIVVVALLTVSWYFFGTTEESQRTQHPAQESASSRMQDWDALGFGRVDFEHISDSLENRQALEKGSVDDPVVDLARQRLLRTNVSKYLASISSFVDEADLYIRRSRGRRAERLVFGIVLSLNRFGAGVRADRLSSQIEVEILEHLVETVARMQFSLPEEERMDKEQIKVLLAKGVTIDVSFAAVPRDTALVVVKALPTVDSNYYFVLSDVSAAANMPGRLLYWDDPVGLRRAATSTDAMLATVDCKIFFGPAPLKVSRVLDLCTSTSPGVWSMSEAERFRPSIKSLGLNLLRLAEPVSGAQVTTTDKKGWIRLAAISKDGSLQTFGPAEYRTPLYRTRACVLARDYLRDREQAHSAFHAMFPDPAKLPFGEILTEIISTSGNFEIEYIPDKGARSKRGSFKITASERIYCAFYRKGPGHESDSWHDPANYEPIARGNPTDIVSRYLLTRGGDRTKWAIFEIILGSPAIDRVEVGGVLVPTIRADDEMRLALSNYSRICQYRDFVVLEQHLSQGVLATALSQSGRRYLKLLAAPHVSDQRTPRIVADLQKAGYIPNSVSGLWIDPASAAIIARGAESRRGWYLLDSAEYPTVTTEVSKQPRPRGLWLVRVFHAVAEFICRIWKIGVACPDWGLPETALISEGDRLQVFVLDFGSYMYCDNMRRDRNNRKIELRAPEDYPPDADAFEIYDAERNQAYVVGLLLLQGVTGSWNSPFAFHYARNKEAWESAVRDEVRAGCDLGCEGLAPESKVRIESLMVNLLRWRPTDRPTLTQTYQELTKILENGR